jgi:hypothetical protein
MAPERSKRAAASSADVGGDADADDDDNADADDDAKSGRDDSAGGPGLEGRMVSSGRNGWGRSGRRVRRSERRMVRVRRCGERRVRVSRRWGGTCADAGADAEAKRAGYITDYSSIVDCLRGALGGRQSAAGGRPVFGWSAEAQ